jgi:hypothetical protein
VRAAQLSQFPPIPWLSIQEIKQEQNKTNACERTKRKAQGPRLTSPNATPHQYVSDLPKAAKQSQKGHSTSESSLLAWLCNALYIFTSDHGPASFKCSISLVQS